MSIVKDTALAESGRRKIHWVRDFMPALGGIEARFEKEKPFAGLRVAVSVHLEAKTANLGYVLSKGGAEVRLTGSNPLSTQDDVAAGLASMGVETFGIHGADPETYKAHLLETLSFKPHLIVDDGGDLVHLLGSERPDLAEHLMGGCEETTTGILRLKAREREGILPCPMMAVNDAKAKHYYDNKYGTGQSVWDAIMHTTNLVVAGKTVVVAGYGWCGKGVAMRASGMGANVIVTEVDPFKALDATM
ncbi:MAG: adenosylhomocysteinase, partial [Flavonifractor sp.]|nr:adenosylhomocysteinase [Flavonifractor sp.]